MLKSEKFGLVQDYVAQLVEDEEVGQVYEWARLYLIDLYASLHSEALVEMIKEDYPDWFDEEE